MKELTHKKFFFQVLDILEKNGIEYCLACGTLLSAVRDKKFLPQDHKDTDLMVDRKDYWKVRDLFNKEYVEGRMLHSFIRRGELTIISLCNKFKVDVFAMDKDEDNYYMYSCEYNPESGVWDKEWRVTYPYKLFYPLRTIEFLGRSMWMPNNYREVLEVHYGKDWKTPDDNWDSNNPPHKDLDYRGYSPAGFSYSALPYNMDKKPLAFICINFMRKESTKTTITSLQEHYKDCQIYIADQDAPTAEMVKFYEMHSIKYTFLPFDCGLSFCRNYLIDQVEEPYIMWGDNDFIFDKNNHIKEAIEVLQSKKKIGVVGGSILKNNILQHYERQLIYDKDNGILVYIPLDYTDPKEYKYKNLPYYYCDLTFNIAIAKKEIFNNKKIRWNPNLKVRMEHSDLFLRLKLFCKSKVVYFPSLMAHHVHTGSSEYKRFRFRKVDGEKFAKDWKLRMNFTIGQGKEIYNGKVTSIKQKKNVIETKEEAQTIKKDIKLITINPTIEQVLYNFTRCLEEMNKEYYLLEKTCLDALKYRSLTGEDLYIGVILSKENTQHLLKEGFSLIKEGLFKQQGIKIHIKDFIPKQSKNVNIKNDSYQIPLPVVQYLEKLYGKDWAKD